METFTKIKEFAENPDYYEDRQKSISNLKIGSIDKPIIDLIKRFLKLPYCFTIQSCYGHFVYKGQKNPNNTEPLPISKNIKTIEYRIAYLALCLQNSKSGKILFKRLSTLPQIDCKYIQFGCAEWFWERQINSYTLQVEPERYSTKDRVFIDYKEALYIENIRNKFFKKMEDIIHNFSDHL